jgi:hypothetical protein
MATSIIIDPAKARFFRMALFPCCVRIPDHQQMRIAA